MVPSRHPQAQQQSARACASRPRKSQRGWSSRVLTVIAVGIAPADALAGRDVQVVLDVLEGVLGDMGDTAVEVLPQLTRSCTTRDYLELLMVRVFICLILLWQ